MRIFNNHAVCLKCDDRWWTVAWHQAKPENVSLDGCSWPEEHMHHTCRRCGFEWQRAPLTKEFA